MPMGIVNDDDFNSELTNVGIIKNNEPKIIDIPTKGRSEGDTNVPDSLRKIIGEESVIEGRSSALNLARRFGISPSSVSAYNNGSTSTSSMDESPNKPHLIDAKERVSKRARTKLILALNSLTSQKIEDSKARDIAGIAKDMSAIIKNMEPNSDKSIEINNKPQFVFYAPQVKSEESFDVIYAKE